MGRLNPIALNLSQQVLNKSSQFSFSSLVATFPRLAQLTGLGGSDSRFIGPDSGQTQLAPPPKNLSGIFRTPSNDSTPNNLDTLKKIEGELEGFRLTLQKADTTPNNAIEAQSLHNELSSLLQKNSEIADRIRLSHATPEEKNNLVSQHLNSVTLFQNRLLRFVSESILPSSKSGEEITTFVTETPLLGSLLRPYSLAIQVAAGLLVYGGTLLEAEAKGKQKKQKKQEPKTDSSKKTGEKTEVPPPVQNASKPTTIHPPLVTLPAKSDLAPVAAGPNLGVLISLTVGALLIGATLLVINRRSTSPSPNKTPSLPPPRERDRKIGNSTKIIFFEGERIPTFEVSPSNRNDLKDFTWKYGAVNLQFKYDPLTREIYVMNKGRELQATYGKRLSNERSRFFPDQLMNVSEGGILVYKNGQQTFAIQIHASPSLSSLFIPTTEKIEKTNRGSDKIIVGKVALSLSRNSLINNGSSYIARLESIGAATLYVRNFTRSTTWEKRELTPPQNLSTFLYEGTDLFSFEDPETDPNTKIFRMGRDGKIQEMVQKDKSDFAYASTSTALQPVPAALEVEPGIVAIEMEPASSGPENTLLSTHTPAIDFDPEKPVQIELFPLRQYSLGRSNKNLIKIDDRSVSREHLLLKLYENGTLEISPRYSESYARTLIDGVPVLPNTTTAVKPGQILQIGELFFKLSGKILMPIPNKGTKLEPKVETLTIKRETEETYSETEEERVVFQLFPTNNRNIILTEESFKISVTETGNLYANGSKAVIQFLKDLEQFPQIRTNLPGPAHFFKEGDNWFIEALGNETIIQNDMGSLITKPYKVKNNEIVYIGGIAVQVHLPEICSN